MDNVYKRIHDIGIIPVTGVIYAEDAGKLAKSLCDGGLPVAEVTYGTEAAHDAVIEIKKACPDMLIGAGPILTVEQVDSALHAGAGFITTPIPDPDIVRYCQSRNIPVIPGFTHAGEIEAAMSMGLDTLIFSPAKGPDGLKTIKALSETYGTIKFLASGGLTLNDISEYLKEPCISACAGNWMIDEKAIKEKNFGMIEELTGCAVKTMLGITIKHIGINDENEEGADLAYKFAGIFRGKVRESVKGWFGSEFAEIMSSKFRTGTHGHIGIGVNDPDRARCYYEALGYSFDENTAGYFENGDLEIIYFSGEFGGFALHIVKK